MTQYVADLQTSLTAAYMHVQEQMGAKLDRQKEVYDKRSHGKPYEKGDLVWLNTPVVPRGQAKKLHHPWAGPYRIVTKLSEAVYRIQHVRLHKKHQVVHFDRLKHCPADIGLPKAARYTREPGIPTADLPLGSGLELVDHDEPNQDGPDPQPNTGSESTPPSAAAPTVPPPRYPRRIRVKPDRLILGIQH